MILQIEQNDTTTNVDIGDVNAMTADEKTQALDTAMTTAGLDPAGSYIILGEVE